MSDVAAYPPLELRFFNRHRVHLRLRFSGTRQVPPIKHGFLLGHIVAHDLESDSEVTHNGISSSFSLSKERKVLPDSDAVDVRELADQTAEFEHRLAKKSSLAARFL